MTTADSERIEALERRIKIIESVLANLLAAIEDDADDDADPLEDMEGIRLPEAPGRGVSTW